MFSHLHDIFPHFGVIVVELGQGAVADPTDVIGWAIAVIGAEGPFFDAEPIEPGGVGGRFLGYR